MRYFSENNDYFGKQTTHESTGAEAMPRLKERFLLGRLSASCSPSLYSKRRCYASLNVELKRNVTRLQRLPLVEAKIGLQLLETFSKENTCCILTSKVMLLAFSITPTSIFRSNTRPSGVEEDEAMVRLLLGKEGSVGSTATETSVPGVSSQDLAHTQHA